MTTITVTIGWTQSDMPRYSSFDGYEPGARQHTEDVEVNIAEYLAEFGRTVEGLPDYVASAAFTATNDPGRVQGIALQIREALAARGFNGSASGHYSLSVGDTVTVSEVTLACARFGWGRVVLEPRTEPEAQPIVMDPAARLAARRRRAANAEAASSAAGTPRLAEFERLTEGLI